MTTQRSAVELGRYRGFVLSTLGRHREAADALTWVLERMDPSKVMRRATVAVDRDAALAQLRLVPDRIGTLDLR